MQYAYNCKYNTGVSTLPEKYAHNSLDGVHCLQRVILPRGSLQRDVWIALYKNVTNNIFFKTHPSSTLWICLQLTRWPLCTVHIQSPGILEFKATNCPWNGSKYMYTVSLRTQITESVHPVLNTLLQQLTGPRTLTAPGPYVTYPRFPT